MCGGEKKKKVDFLMFVTDPEIIHARVVMYFMAPQTKDYWQDIVCCLQTFMQEKPFGLRQGIHLHVHDAALQLIIALGRGQLSKASLKQA